MRGGRKLSKRLQETEMSLKVTTFNDESYDVEWHLNGLDPMALLEGVADLIIESRKEDIDALEVSMLASYFADILLGEFVALSVEEEKPKKKHKGNKNLKRVK
jgi:hypothetical protein